MAGIDDEAIDGMSVAPGEPKDQGAGQDEAINRRLKDDPTSKDAQLDEALDETMDASDPVSTIQPGRSGDPAPSSGYDEEAERQRDA